MSRPGKLDQRIEINRVSARTPDGLGGFTETVTKLTDAWAAVNPKGGREQSLADRLDAAATVVFRIRVRPDLELLENDRIVWKGRQYNIRVIEDAGNRVMYWDILAERGVAQ